MSRRLLRRVGAALGAVALTVPLAPGLAVAQEAPGHHPPTTRPPLPEHEGLVEETFEVGPFELGPGESVGSNGGVVPRPEGDIAIRSIDWEFVDGDGNAIPPDVAHLHHLVLLEDSRRDSLCSSPSQARFAGTGAALNDFVLPEDAAYHLPPEASVYGVYEVQNLSDAPLTASIRYTVGHTDGAADDFVHLDQYFFDVTGCWNEGGSAYDVPGDGGPGSVHERSHTVTVRRDGVLRFGGGHLHEGGIDVTLTGPDGEVCRSAAVHDDGGHGHGGVPTNPCTGLGEEFEAGDEYTLTARYENDEPVAGAMGILATYAHHTSPPPPPPPPPTVTVDGARRGVLTGTVTCEGADPVWFHVDVRQETRAIPVTGWAGSSADCGGEPTRFEIPISGDGILAPRRLEYRVEAWGSETTEPVVATGEVRHRGFADLATEAPEPLGPLPITIDRVTRRSEAGPVATGTVTCDEPTEVALWLDGRQRSGRNHLPVDAYAQVSCDGETPFELPFRSSSGQLRPGLATVVVHAEPAEWMVEPVGEEPVPVPVPEPSVASQRVVVLASTPDQEFPVIPDPTSPLTIGSLTRVEGELQVELGVPACPADASISVSVVVRPPEVRARHRWFDPRLAGRGEQLLVPCADEPSTTVATLPDVRGDELAVEVDAWVDEGPDAPPQWYTNGALVTLEG